MFTCFPIQTLDTDNSSSLFNRIFLLVFTFLFGAFFYKPSFWVLRFSVNEIFFVFFFLCLTYTSMKVIWTVLFLFCLVFLFFYSITFEYSINVNVNFPLSFSWIPCISLLPFQIDSSFDFKWLICSAAQKIYILWYIPVYIIQTPNSSPTHTHEIYIFLLIVEFNIHLNVNTFFCTNKLFLSYSWM